MHNSDHPAGDADIAGVAVLFGEPSRARILTALADGRALPASVLASETGLSAAATSAHLSKLRNAGLVDMEPSGRYRYYRLASREVAAVIEAMAQIAPTKPIRSLREGTRAHALRVGRTCYDHLAGRLGVAVMAYLLEQGALEANDGISGPQRRASDRLSASVAHHPYALGAPAGTILDGLGVDLGELRQAASASRPLLRFCMDWTEQRHHIAGSLGAAICTAFTANGWITRKTGQRAVALTPAGRSALGDLFELPSAS